MVVSAQTESFDKRLSQQLHVFSELSEMLTLRVLDLDERFKELEESRQFVRSLESDKNKELLLQTADRLSHLQSLLKEECKNKNACTELDGNNCELVMETQELSLDLEMT